MRIRDQVSQSGQSGREKKNAKWAGLAMVINGSIRDFVCSISAKGQITLGDVRRLQRGYLPGGITNRQELDILISLNAKLVRADKAWAQWLVSVVADFVTNEASGRPFEDAAEKWVERLLAASTTKLALRIARQVRRELARQRALQSTRVGGALQTRYVPPPPIKAPEPDDRSLRNSPGTAAPACDAHESPDRSGAPRPISERIPAINFTTAAHGWCLANYVRDLRRSEFMNFQSSRTSPVLAPCHLG
jgi:hypothetical protein